MTIRRPSTRESVYRWWRDALAGKAPPTHDSDPQCGYYQRRLIRGGPYVPCSIYLEQDVDIVTGELLAPERLLCEVAGQFRDPESEWTWLAKRPITEEQYLEMLMGGSAEPGSDEAPELEVPF